MRMLYPLKHGSHVEVLEPGWLREKVVKELKDAVGKFRRVNE
jgi:predicted DNA-binding transcriptional regulator YafY